jgi:hypothetical protein
VDDLALQQMRSEAAGFRDGDLVDIEDAHRPEMGPLGGCRNGRISIAALQQQPRARGVDLPSTR